MPRLSTFFLDNYKCLQLTTLGHFSSLCILQTQNKNLFEKMPRKADGYRYLKQQLMCDPCATE